MGSVRINGMLDNDVRLPLRPTIISNEAFMSGSSKQGNMSRAATGSNCVDANHLSEVHANISNEIFGRLFQHCYWKVSFSSSHLCLTKQVSVLYQPSVLDLSYFIQQKNP